MNKNKFPYTFLGRKHSKETIEKMRLSKLGKKRPPFSKEWIKRIVESRKGYKHSEETKKKIGRSNKEHFELHPERKSLLSKKQKEAWLKNPNRNIDKSGLVAGWSAASDRKKEKNNRVCPVCGNNFYRRGNRNIKILCCSKECFGISISGENSHFWINGKSREPYPLGWRSSLKNKIRIRDNNNCFVCKKYGKHVHHIDYNKENINLSNLITLCSSCHSKTNKNRKYWESYFEKTKKII